MQTNLAPEERVILRTLAYYDIFNYPLTEKDISENFSMYDLSDQSYRKILNDLIERGVVYKLGEYYSLTNDHQNVKDRIAGNERARKWMKKARRFSRLISGFPYVRSVALSGSLSKGFIGEDPDIDYFIITKPNRLWLARTLLVAFKKIFLFNSYKYFCINYFIDTENLEIEEKNLFTATEVITLIPVFGEDIARKFFTENRWTEHYFPNYQINGLDEVLKPNSHLLKGLIEFILNGKLGEWLDTRFMDITVNHWHKKFKSRYNEDEFNLVFKSTKKISKHHPQNFQKKVLKEYNLKLKELKDKHKIDIEPETDLTNLN